MEWCNVCDKGYCGEIEMINEYLNSSMANKYCLK